jgi:glycine cleavage system H protein
MIGYQRIPSQSSLFMEYKMNFPENLLYTNTHEWFDPQTGRIGLTDHAQQELGDIVYCDSAIDLDTVIEAGSILGSVDSVKTVSDIYMPVTGRLVAKNQAIADDPELVNRDPYGEGWLFQIEVDGNLPDTLIDAKSYRAKIGLA